MTLKQLAVSHKYTVLIEVTQAKVEQVSTANKTETFLSNVLIC